MQIVIDIPEEMYQKIKETSMVISGRRSGKRFDYILFNAVNTGTPLPKGHGRIIDESQVTGTFTWDNGVIECFAPTIIEADKVESEDKE